MIYYYFVKNCTMNIIGKLATVINLLDFKSSKLCMYEMKLIKDIKGTIFISCYSKLNSKMYIKRIA
jgi:hypothetical protein